MGQSTLRTIVASPILLLLFQACTGWQTSKAPDRSIHLPSGELQSKIVLILEQPPFEYEIIKAAEGKIRARKEYPGDPYGLPFLGKRMNERTLVSVRLEPDPEASDSTNLFVDVIIEETESFRTGWVVKDDPEKQEEILSTLLQRLDEEP